MSKLNVDETKCIGCGVCVSTYPDNFDFSEQGLSKVISEENLDENMESICPVGAITITKEDEQEEN